MSLTASDYAALGYRVFPCIPGTKKPLTTHGVLDATDDLEQIAAWWAATPDANVGLATEGLIVIDVDPGAGEWCTEAEAMSLADCPQATTPRDGQHILCRQPTGKGWRNTASKLAEHVDTRGNGGYICVEPSVVDGKTYRLVVPLVPREDLPEPPAWLIARLEALANVKPVATAPTDDNTIPDGRRNATLTSLAGSLRRIGLGTAEILATIRTTNAERCRPPLSDGEVATIADSVARYESDQIATAMAEGWADTPLPGPVTVRSLLETNPKLRPVVVHGLLRRGETANLIAPPKTGKSWLALSLAMSVATGARWLGAFDCEPGQVLVVDNELHTETIAHRIPRVAAALGSTIEQMADILHVVSLRGALCPLADVERLIAKFPPETVRLVILDAFYRFIGEASENDNAAVAGMYNILDGIAMRRGCAFVLIHHTSKGSQSEKAVTDVGAGAGSQSRAADAHIALRPHEEPGCVVLDGGVRSFPPIEPLVLRWTFPVWQPAPELDPGALRVAKGRRGGQATAWTAERAVTWLAAEPKAAEVVVASATRSGCPAATARRLLLVAEADGLAYRHVGARGAIAWALVPQPIDTRGTDAERVRLYISEHPDADVESVVQSVGCSIRTAQREINAV